MVGVQVIRGVIKNVGWEELLEFRSGFIVWGMAGWGCRGMCGWVQV